MVPNRTTKHVKQFAGWFVTAVVLLLLLSVLFGWNLTRLHNVLEKCADKDVPQLVLKQISVLIALIGVGFGALYFHFRDLPSKIEKINEYHQHVLHLMDTFIKLNIYELPLRSYTQHIPLERFRIFEQLETAFGLYEDLHPQNGKRTANTAEYIINFVRGVICNKKTDQSIIYFRKAAEVAKDVDRNATIDALWRLGIAYRQERQFEESWEVFDELEGLAPERSELWSLALQGKMLTRYAQFKSSNGYTTWIWSEDQSRGANHLLTEAEREFEELWKAGFHEPQFVSFYGALIKMESGQSPIFNETNLLTYTINESLVGEKLYPYNEDYAILADFYLSIAVCFELLHRIEGAVQDHNLKRDYYVEKAKKYAKLVQSDYGDYNTIYSERELREVAAGQFLLEIANWLHR